MGEVFGILNRERHKMKKRSGEEQLIGLLREAEQSPDTFRDVCRRHNITEQTFFRWRNIYGGMDVSEARS